MWARLPAPRTKIFFPGDDRPQVADRSEHPGAAWLRFVFRSTIALRLEPSRERHSGVRNLVPSGAGAGRDLWGNPARAAGISLAFDLRRIFCGSSNRIAFKKLASYRGNHIR